MLGGPLDHASARPRPLDAQAGRDGDRDPGCQAALRAPTSTSAENWQRRLRTTRTKIAGGNAVELAEVVRDGNHRVQSLTQRGTPGGLSPNERQLYLKARQLLATELGVSRGLEPAQAEAWIDTQLATPEGP